ncbi:hypothetical protein E2C01_069718 [Portunus trituberculatus]|uniref:Uncharacterized protein n=1 Tax=Portunus trituberculatus TaxID=210409 RepID=A0A5B7HVA7_PORTR|nr:hypothetical protein [Portunus trituberculatus]
MGESEKYYNKNARSLPPLRIGDHVRLQVRATKRWYKIGVVVVTRKQDRVKASRCGFRYRSVAAHDHAGARIVLARNKPGEGDVRSDAPTSQRSALRFLTVNSETVKADVGTSTDTPGQTHASSSTQSHLQSPAAVSYNPVLRSCSKHNIADVYYYSLQFLL